MAKKLKSLDEHNKKIWADNAYNLEHPILNGFACPLCRKELVDCYPKVDSSSWPPQKEVRCSDKECIYKGIKFV